MTVSHVDLSRLVSHALRHEPWVYELELDESGWVSVDELLDAVHRIGLSWEHVSQQDLVDMISSSSKRRHEIKGEKIRALYGHSLPGRIMKIEAAPPELLFHGTAPAALDAILTEGLRPMDRQYVHLSVDVATAEQVGRRKSHTPVILGVRAAAARESGLRFWRGNDMVWLSEFVPAEFIRVE